MGVLSHAKVENDLFAMYEFTDGMKFNDETILLKWVSSDKELFNANLVLGLYYRSMGFYSGYA